MKKIVLIASIALVFSFFNNGNVKLTNFEKDHFVKKNTVVFYTESDPGGGS